MALKAASAPRARSDRTAAHTVRAVRLSQVRSAAAGHRAGGGAAATAPATIKDPRFRQVMAKLTRSAAQARAHQPASSKATEAEASAHPPPNERMAGAKSNKVEALKDAPTGKVTPTTFLETLRASIREVMPKKTEDVGDYMKGDDRHRLEGAVAGNVDQQKQESTADLKATSKAPPDTAGVPEQAAIPMPDPQPGAPPPVGAAEAMPSPKTGAAVSFDQNRSDSDKLLTDNELTGPQLGKANDPRFGAVLQTKGEADRFAEKAPAQFRTREQGVLSTAEKQAVGDERQGLTGLHGQALGSAKKVKSHQLSQREKDERARKEVADHVEGIFTRTKQSVDDRLASLDKEVETMFGQGVDGAIERMKSTVEDRFDDRYSGITGRALRVKDFLFPLPGKVKEWFTEAHEVFTKDLDALVVRVAALVEARLAEAKALIAAGQLEIHVYVAGLPTSLRAAGDAAEREMNGRFDELRQSVEDKKGDLARALATRYKEATEKGDKALQDLKDAHKSLYEKVRDAVLTVVRILREFKDKVLAMLKKAAGVIGIIVGDPIGFLGNVLAAIGKGLGQFVDHIWTHLREGFMTWLLGPLGEAGIALPKDLSLPSLLKLVLEVLGLTYDRIRAKAVSVLGERSVMLIEKVAGAIKVLITEGPEKLWEMMKEYLGDLKATIIDAIQDWLITTIVKAAVTKLVSMFNPVGAIIQAILTIYNVVMFLIENITKIIAFVESVMNSIADIANGAIATAANWIEKALARAVPIMIGFLARLLGISGITDKIIGTIKKLQAKVDHALGKVIEKVAGGIAKVVGAAREVGGRIVSMIFPKKIIVVDGEKHTMEVEDEDQNYEVVVHSNRMRIPELVKRARNKPVPPKIVDPLEEKYREWRSFKKPDDPVAQKAQYEKRSELFQKMYEKATPVLEKVFGADEVTVVKWSSLDSEGRATRVQANPLTKKGVKGSPPGEKIPGHDTALYYDGDRVAYIRTHLLHHELGGPGRSVNLTPTSNSLNQKIFNRVEEKAIQEVQKGEKLIYTVDLEYRTPTAGQKARVKPAADADLLKFVAYRMTFNVTYKDTHKQVVPKFSEPNWV